jgi:allophanate hydrolase
MADFDLDLARLRAAYAAGLDPRQLIERVHQQIDACGDGGIFISLVDREAALAEAGRIALLDRTSLPLWGVPFAVKDNIDVAGLPTTAACPDFAYTPAESAPVVERLREAGAILVGKTNLDQFATGLVGVRTPYPAPKNPFDSEVIPGGSSSGSAVAVARGMVSFSLGTDTAGSGRVPAALNNLVGLKPSLGLVSTRGVVPACRTLDCVSIFAFTVDDAWAVLRVIAGFDARDPFSRPIDAGDVHAVPPGLRVGVPTPAGRRFFGDAMAAGAFDQAVALLPGLGLSVTEVDIEALLETAALLYDGPWVAERYAAIRPFIEGRPGSLLPVTRQIIEGARKRSAADAFSGFYALAERRRATAAVWRDIDVLVVPTIPSVCRLADVAREPVVANSRLGTYTNFVNLLDLCALAVPGPFRADGLPAGMTLLAPAGRDGLLASLGRVMQAAAATALGATTREPPPLPRLPSGGDGRMALAVVGAHLSGMPLNAELTAAGATFLRAVPTEPCYRLFALAGTTPSKPGLLRVADAAGGAGIETEVWALAPDAFGRFVAQVPPPLAIGTLHLADGTRPKGFLVEPEGLAGAVDITVFGGWRAYLRAAG